MPKTKRFQQAIDKYREVMISRRKDSRLEDPVKLDKVIANMNLVYTRQTVLFCIDVEAFERNTKIVTEVGISIYDPRGQEFALAPVLKNFHILVSENLKLKNGRFVPEHSQNFSGAVSYVLSKKETRATIQLLVDEYFSGTFPCALVGHDVQGDIKWLHSLKITFPKNALTLDTQKMFALSYGKRGSSLKNALTLVEQPFAFLHNAGNDAYYTVMLALKLCDPSVRKLIDFDIYDPEETREEKIYPKLTTNSSRITRIAPIFDFKSTPSSSVPLASSANPL